jgi:predicted ABC-type transport system involved in lysophospholipase L1 biosynthesis ATPase subunit
MTAPAPVVSVRELVKNYQALRPLRMTALAVEPRDVIALGGLDAAAAEILVGMLTGAVLPDSGEVRLFGRSTTDVTTSEDWLTMLDRVGILTDRAVLIGQFTVEQNVAMPFTLSIDPVDDAVRPRVRALIAEVGLSEPDATARVGDAGAEIQARVRVARALALDPVVLLAEHPTATLPRDQIRAFASDLRRIAAGRSMALLAITQDDEFARALGGERLTLEPATGALTKPSSWRRIFGS